MKIPDGCVDILDTLTNKYVFTAEQNTREVITFACEAKCVTQVAASRQLTLYLCSAQHQRRALCFDDGPVYGVTIVGNRLTMHSSKWVEDQVVSVTFFFVQLQF